MRLTRIPLHVLFVLSGCAIAPSTEVVGLWQFPNRSVWIEFRQDGTAFQCRIARSGEVYKSNGRRNSTGDVTWDWGHWGTDRIKFQGQMLVLEGKLGSFSYGQAKTPVEKACYTTSET